MLWRRSRRIRKTSLVRPINSYDLVDDKDEFIEEKTLIAVPNHKPLQLNTDIFCYVSSARSHGNFCVSPEVLPKSIFGTESEVLAALAAAYSEYLQKIRENE